MSGLPLVHGLSDGWHRTGSVVEVTDALLRVQAPGLCAGSIVAIRKPNGAIVHAQVRSIDARGSGCVPLRDVEGVALGNVATSDLSTLGAYVGFGLLGRVVDAFGCASDPSVRGIVVESERRIFDLRERIPIAHRLSTGVFAIDAFAALGYGQRVALAAGAGVGKSLLLRRIVAGARADARVVALIGERSRDAIEAIEALRASDAWPTTTVVWAGQDAPAIQRLAAARTASAQAEWLCARGLRVLLAVDSLTRVATAWRELALAAGESPAHRGHPPSLVPALAALVERAGARACGSITGIYAILVDGDDPFEPVADAVRGLLDGHIALSRRLADAGRYPAIDVLRSLSRTMPAVVSERHLQDAALLRRALATLEESEDLFAIGAYRRGADPWLDACADARPRIDAHLFEGDGPGREVAHVLAELAAHVRAGPGLKPAAA